MERKRYDQIYFPVVPAVQSDIFIKLLASHFEVCKDALKIVIIFVGAWFQKQLRASFIIVGHKVKEGMGEYFLYRVAH